MALVAKATRTKAISTVSGSSDDGQDEAENNR